LSNSMQKIVQKHNFYRSNYVRNPEIREIRDFNRKFLQERQTPRNYDDITKEEYKEAIKISKNCLDWAKK